MCRPDFLEVEHHLRALHWAPVSRSATRCTLRRFSGSPFLRFKNLFQLHGRIEHHDSRRITHNRIAATLSWSAPTGRDVTARAPPRNPCW